MLIHQLSSVSWGKYEALKDDMKNNDMLMDRIRKIYQEHTNIPKTKLDQILKHDLWWDAETCLKYGLVCHSWSYLYGYSYNNCNAYVNSKVEKNDKEASSKIT